jgi:uncharacterized protein
MTRDSRKWIWWFNRIAPFLTGLMFIVPIYPASADHLPPGVQVIHLHTPAYLQRPLGSGPYSQQDIQDAMELAKIGDAEAQSNLGVMLASRGEFAKAAYWYREAAEAGIGTAAYNLGTLYFNGQGVTQNYAKAHDWFLEAAKRGNAYAEFQLGMTYYTGQGVEKDPAQEMHWYLEAARQGLPAAQYNLAVIYHNGEEVQQDEVKAYAWMLLAQQNGLDASGALSTMASGMSPEKIKEAEKMSHNLAAPPEQNTE